MAAGCLSIEGYEITSILNIPCLAPTFDSMGAFEETNLMQLQDDVSATQLHAALLRDVHPASTVKKSEAPA
ncbi:unnamed protein product, partial [Mesorhabditis spiculigera]